MHSGAGPQQSGASRKVASVLRLVLLLLPLLVSIRADALPQFADLFKKTYTIKPSGTVAAAVTKCTLCHVAAGPPKLNLYGASVKAALTAASAGQNLTPAILHTLDAQDADGDGATNADEIAADTLPGDPNSKPASFAINNKGLGPKSVLSGVSSGDETASKPLAEEIRGLLLPKHAQHPLVVHFPIALFFISVLSICLATGAKTRR